MAIVLFGALTTPAYSTANDIVIYFIRVLFISPLVGIALGIGKSDIICFICHIFDSRILLPSRS